MDISIVFVLQLLSSKQGYDLVMDVAKQIEIRSKEVEAECISPQRIQKGKMLKPTLLSSKGIDLIKY